MLRDYYEVLGVPHDADEDAIERAYRELTKEHHPARNPGSKEAEARFREVQEAYGVLSEETKRTEYDQVLVAQAAFGPSETSGQGAPTEAGHCEETLSERRGRLPHGRVMKCEAAQDWLLQCESLQPKSWPRGVVKHLRVCPACYQFGKSVKRLERAWRNLPLPEECEVAKTDFLAKLADLEQTEKPKPKRDRRPKRAQTPQRRPAWGMRGLAIAACLFIGIIGVGWLIPGRSTNKNVASSEVVEDLVAWNVAMVNAEPKERKRIYEEYEGTFRTDLKRAVLAGALSAEDSQLADDLLDSGRQLANAGDDPMAEAEIVTKIAGKLFKQAADADNKGNEKETERCGMRYSRFNAYAVKPMWNRFNPPDKKGGDKDKGGFDKDKGGSDKGFDKGPNDQKKFEMLFKGSPEFSRPDLHNKFDGWGKKVGPPGFGPIFGPKGGKR